MYEEEYEFAKSIAIEAGEYLSRRDNIQVESAIGKDIKLSSDKASEKIIIDGLSRFNYTILSEEYGFMDKGTDLCWIVDPLDGTMNYSKGMDDLTGVSIALWEKNQPIFGVIYRYRNNELFTGKINKGAYLNNKAIKSSQVEEISQAVLGTGFPVRREYNDASIENFIKDSQRYKKVRMLGTAAIMAVYVACGRLDVYKEENVMLWDIASAVAIVEAAGGIVDLEHKDNYKCICKCYANKRLREEDNLT